MTHRDFVEQLRYVREVVDEQDFYTAPLPAASESIFASLPDSWREVQRVSLPHEDRNVSTLTSVAVQVPDEVGIGKARSDKEAVAVQQAVLHENLLPRLASLHPVVVLLREDERPLRPVAAGVTVQVSYVDRVPGFFRTSPNVRMNPPCRDAGLA